MNLSDYGLEFILIKKDYHTKQFDSFSEEVILQTKSIYKFHSYLKNIKSLEPSNNAGQVLFKIKVLINGSTLLNGEGGTSEFSDTMFFSLSIPHYYSLFIANPIVTYHAPNAIIGANAIACMIEDILKVHDRLRSPKILRGIDGNENK